MTGARAQPAARDGDPPLIVGMTTLPSRLEQCRAAIDSVLGNRRPPDRFVLSIPRVPLRGAAGFSGLPAFLGEEPYRERIIVNLLDEDFGPGSKLLGVLPFCDGPSVVVIVDDDMAYREFMLESLYARQVERKQASFTYYRYRYAGLPVGQGADGLSFWSEQLGGIAQFYDRHVRDTRLRMHDDLWISFFLYSKGIEIVDLSASLRGVLIYRSVHDVDALCTLAGEHSREALSREGMTQLLRSGSLGAGRRARLGVARGFQRVRELGSRILRRASRSVTERN